MNKQQKINAIYEKIANKELSFGCSFLCQKGTDKRLIRRVIIATNGDDFLTVFPDFPYQKITNHPFIDRVPKNCILKTIGHPVMIGDVMNYLNFQTKFSMASLYYIVHDDLAFIIENWKDKRKPIEDQTDECIDFIYNLITN